MRVLVEEFCELQRSVAHPMVEQEGHGVAQDLPKQPAGQVPEILGPHPLYRVASGELKKDGVDTVSEAAEKGTAFGSWVSPLGRVGREQFDTLVRQLFFCLERVVVAVPDDDPVGAIGQFGKHAKLVDVGRGDRQTADDARPANSHVHPEAVEGLLEQRVFAKSGLPTEAFTAIGASEEARRQGHRESQMAKEGS